jgi:hypothetical protein
MTLVRHEGDDGFRLEAAGTVVLDAMCAKDGWTVHGPIAGDRSWRLARAEEAAGGLVLYGGEGTDAEEIGRATPLGGPFGLGSDTSVLVSDGRLFRAGFLTGPVPAFHLAGWEVPGPYLTAEANGPGWVIRRTPAGQALEDDAGVVVLFAAILAGPR